MGGQQGGCAEVRAILPKLEIATVFQEQAISLSSCPSLPASHSFACALPCIYSWRSLQPLLAMSCDFWLWPAS